MDIVQTNNGYKANTNNENQKKDNNSTREDRKVSDNLLVLRSGVINIELPREDSNIDILISVLNGMKSKKNRRMKM